MEIYRFDLLFHKKGLDLLETESSCVLGRMCVFIMIFGFMRRIMFWGIIRLGKVLSSGWILPPKPLRVCFVA